MTSQTANDQATNLIVQFRFSHGVFQQNVKGFTHVETLEQPAAGGNCMNWVGGHIASARNGALRLVGQPTFLSDDEAQRYARGSDAITEPAMAMDWGKILAAMSQSQEALVNGLGAMSTDQLAAALPADRNPFDLGSVGQMLATMAFHEAYHVGQLGVLRRIYGKKGAIA